MKIRYLSGKHFSAYQIGFIKSQVSRLCDNRVYICKWTQSVTLLPYRLISRCDKRTLFILEEKLQRAATNEKACRHSDMFRVGFNTVLTGCGFAQRGKMDNLLGLQ